MELQEFPLGSCPPTLGLHGIRWSTEGDQVCFRFINTFMVIPLYYFPWFFSLYEEKLSGVNKYVPIDLFNKMYFPIELGLDTGRDVFLQG